VCGLLSTDENTNRKAILVRVVVMLTQLGHRGYNTHEEGGEYRALRNDTDSDSDSDLDRNMKPGDWEKRFPVWQGSPITGACHMTKCIP